MIKKFKKKEAKEAKEKESRESSRPSPVLPVHWEGSLELVRQEEAPLAVYTLAPSIEDRAIGFFTHHYVIGLNGPSRGHLDYLAEISRTQILEEGLLASMKAVGLAAYAHAVHAPSLMKNARYQYVRAIQSTNKALGDPVEVKKDTTLLSIMVLGIFETVTGAGQHSLADWAEHLNGASAVIKIRGPEQIKSPAGRRMLLTVVTSLLIANMQQGLPLPRHLQDYMNAAITFVKTPDPAFRILHTMMVLANLRSEVVKGTLTDGEVIISRALELDGLLLGIQTSNTPGWEYVLMTSSSDSPHIFNGHYHVYYDYWIAQIWNALRTLRVILNEMIRDVLLSGFSAEPPHFASSEYTAQFQISTDALYEMQLGILYSVPQHLGLPGDAKPVGQSGSIMDSEFRVPMTGAWFLLWPLWLAGLMDIATVEIRGFCTRNLHRISEENGIKQAGILASMLENMKSPSETRWNGFQDTTEASEWSEKLRKEFEETSIGTDGDS